MPVGRASGRILRGLGYVTAGSVVTGGALYFVYRPRDVPGLESAQVPPPTYGEGGIFRPPSFPRLKSREEQIADLKASAGVITDAFKNDDQWAMHGEQEEGMNILHPIRGNVIVTLNPYGAAVTFFTHRVRIQESAARGIALVVSSSPTTI